jgi:hypothetical protein
MLTVNSVNQVDDWVNLRRVMASGGTGSPCFCRETGRLAHRNRRVARGEKEVAPDVVMALSDVAGRLRMFLGDMQAGSGVEIRSEQTRSLRRDVHFPDLTEYRTTPLRL